MKNTLDVAFMPSESLKKHDCRIVVDLLRASTQITTFFDIGGQLLFPVMEIGEARELKEHLGKDWLLLGERGGLAPPDFDFGNSPTILRMQCSGKHGIISTSNGTKALLRAADDCVNVLVGCARNSEAVAFDALNKGSSIGVIASGRNGEFSLEDTVCAGMIISKMKDLAPVNGCDSVELTDGAKAALALYEHYGCDILNVCQSSEHGRILTGLGFEEDLAFCSAKDKTETVAKLIRTDGGLPVLVGR